MLSHTYVTALAILYYVLARATCAHTPVADPGFLKGGGSPPL